LFDDVESLHPIVITAPERLAAIRSRDPETIELVVKEALPGLLRAARMSGLEPDGAEDAVQETALVFVRRAGEYDGRASASTWMHGILFRVIAAARRAKARSSERDPIDDVMESRFRPDGRWGRPPVDPAVELNRSEFRASLESCLDELPEPQRAGFVLKEVQGFPTAEICKILEVTANNLGVLLYRARNRLRECLESKHVTGTDDEGM
jgi:RNA polymerase sigma-70 factor (ECF subfamily)